jgi:hypothetical protein
MSLLDDDMFDSSVAFSLSNHFTDETFDGDADSKAAKEANLKKVCCAAVRCRRYGPADPQPRRSRRSRSSC